MSYADLKKKGFQFAVPGFGAPWPEGMAFGAFEEVVIDTAVPEYTHLNDRFGQVVGAHPSYIGGVRAYVVEVMGDAAQVVFTEGELKAGEREWRMTTTTGDKLVAKLVETTKADLVRRLKKIADATDGDVWGSVDLIGDELSAFLYHEASEEAAKLDADGKQ